MRKVSLFSWLLYEKPGFQGRVIALEEGPAEHIVNIWADDRTAKTLDQTGQPVPTAPMVIGSLRLAVRVSFYVHLSFVCCTTSIWLLLLFVLYCCSSPHVMPWNL